MTKQTQNGVYLGIDLGGTKLLIGEADREGNILRHKKYDSGYLTQDEALGVVTVSLDDYLKTTRPQDAPPITAMGMGMIGRVDNAGGIWHQIDTQRDKEIPLAKILSEKYGLPCYIENDVRSAARAEMAFGNGKTSRNFIYLNVGTGLAAGIVENGRPLRGGHYNAGEIGHTCVGIDEDMVCGCGRAGCVENIASGGGIDRRARHLAPEYPGSGLDIPAWPAHVAVAEVFQKADSDPLCGRLAYDAAEALARLIMNLARTSDPDTIVLGGGVMRDGWLLPQILKRLNANNMRFVTNGVLPTSLRAEHIGLLGACTVAMNL